MIDGMIRWSAAFWPAMAVHLWQTTWILVLIALLARGMRRAPARLVLVLWWTALIKLFLPLDLLGGLSGRLIRAIGVGSPDGLVGEGGWVGVTVLFRRAWDPLGRPETTTDPAFVWLTLGWLLGIACVTWRIRPRRVAERALTSSGDSETRARLRAALAGTSIPPSRVVVIEDRHVPAVTGLLRPRIVVPQELFRTLDPDELKAVLLHEEAHRKRRDPLCALVPATAAILFFFYPPVWWLIRRIAEVNEMACDEAVLRTGLPSGIYARSLARTVTMGLTPPVSTTTLHGLRGSPLRRRLVRLQSAGGFHVMPRHRIVLAVAIVVVLVGSLLPQSPGAEPVTERKSFVGLSRLNGSSTLVTRHFEKTRVEEVLAALAAIGSFRLEVEGALPAQRVSLDFENTTLRGALERLALQAGLAYEVDDAAVLTIRSGAPRLAGTDGVTNPRMIPESKVEPVYPESLRVEGIEGFVILQAIIESTGEVSGVEVLRTSVPEYPELAESAVAAIRKWRYDPAELDERPVSVYFTVFVDFKLH